MAKTLKLLEANRRHLDAVAEALVERNRIYRRDLERLLPAISQRPAQRQRDPRVEESRERN